MQTGIVHPSGPSSHFCINSGSVCARYTASGGAAKRLVTITCLSPSVVNVILLIAFFLSSVCRYRPELHPACRSSSQVQCVAFQATDPSLRYPLLRDVVDALCLPRGA